MATLTKEESTIEKLERAGMKAAAEQLRKKAALGRKLMIAYEHYRFVRPEKIDEFNKKLFKETSKRDGSYRYLSLTAIESYDKIPPDHVLENLDVAKERKCFDSFEVVHIMEVKDPILFGRIKNCPDRFFIDQWDNDVRIEDILKGNEG